jgi:GTP-binding protein HflX
MAKKLIETSELHPQEKAIAVTVCFQASSYRNTWPLDEVHQELLDLIASSGVMTIGEVKTKRPRPTPNYLIGKGKAEEIRGLCVEKGASVVIFSEDLSFVQQRNLEALTEVKVIDRTQLILDIFAQRARSQEGKIQVELAQLEYLLPRLIGEGIMLSRLGGGIGTRGPGEQKLEVDRRKLRRRIFKLQQDLEGIMKHRHAISAKRKKKEVPSVALVGYTNAGKSTLLNALTDARVNAENRLFSTLDPVSRMLEIGHHQKIVLTDTVGFLHRLPHHLIEAFKATLETVALSDVLVIVIDAHNENSERRFDAVFEVLKELGAENNVNVICFNKIDLLENAYELRRLKTKFHHAMFVSALKGEGIEDLRAAIGEALDLGFEEVDLKITPTAQAMVSLLYQEGEVLSRDYDDDGNTYIKARVPQKLAHRFKEFVQNP